MDFPSKKIVGEEIAKKTYTTKHTDDGPITGALFITNYRIAFAPQSKKMQHEVLEVPISSIQKFERSSTKKDKIIELQCKDVRQYKFYFQSDEPVDDIEKKFARFSPQSNEKTFAFFNQEKYQDTKGWRTYDAVAEYKRQGITGAKGGAWMISHANLDYGLCETYPRILVVPSHSQDVLSKVAAFRTNRRLPVLSWRHKTKSSVIVRSSQPKVGVTSTSCIEDERLIGMILAASGQQSLVVLDARPKVNAVANHAKGAGYENIHRYENTELEFLGIGNIHAMRDSYKKLRDSILDASTDSLRHYSNLEQSRWLDHILLLMESSVRIVDLVDQLSRSVLIHCSDGWDRTSQLSSLSMLLLDSYYRTFEGFQVLIEKEWLSFGHMFWRRHHGKAQDDRSPIFLQFLDCVWQIMNQFPRHFEFNERFLLDIIDAVHSCQFGTFLFDCEKERIAKASQQTPSFWSYAEFNRLSYTNPYYQPDERPLYPVTDIRFIRLWEGYFCRSASRLPVDRIETMVDYHIKNQKVMKSLSNDLKKLSEEKIIADQRNSDLLREMEKVHLSVQEANKKMAIKDQICESRELEMLELRKEKDTLLELFEKNQILFSLDQPISLNNNEDQINNIQDSNNTTNENNNQQQAQEFEQQQQNQQSNLMDYSLRSLQNRITTFEYNQALLDDSNQQLKQENTRLLQLIMDMEAKFKQTETVIQEMTVDSEKKSSKIKEQRKMLADKQKYIEDQDKVQLMIREQRDELESQLQQLKTNPNTNNENNESTSPSSGNNSGNNSGNTSPNSSSFTSNNNNNGNSDLIVKEEVREPMELPIQRSGTILEFLQNLGKKDNNSQNSQGTVNGSSKNVNNNNNSSSSSSNNSKSSTSTTTKQTNNNSPFFRIRGFAFGGRDIVDVSTVKRQRSVLRTSQGHLHHHHHNHQDMKTIEIIDDYTKEKRLPSPEDKSSTTTTSTTTTNSGGNKSTSPTPTNQQNGSHHTPTAASSSMICNGCSKPIPSNETHHKKKDKIHCNGCEREYQSLKQRNSRCTSCDVQLEGNTKIIGGQLYCPTCIGKIIQGIDDLGF